MSFRVVASLSTLCLFFAACDGELSTSLTDNELGIFLNASHEKSFDEACTEIEALCAETGSGCSAYDFFCAPDTTEEWVCLRLYYACRDGLRPNACDRYDDRCLVLEVAPVTVLDAGAP
ncbi:MAG: hypothetical protein JRH20_18035, partial [Deltaproteobacteria bacterium]|nr:hypothetical protein [Deltaproteobacteria bacterium]